MKIHLKNVGTIKELNFELRRGLTLFCGPNSTGKTYAAYAVYSVLQNLQRLRQDWLDSTQLQELWAKGRLSIELRSVLEKAGYASSVSTQLSQLLARDFVAPQNFFAQDCIAVSEFPVSESIPWGETISQGVRIRVDNLCFLLEVNDTDMSINGPGDPDTVLKSLNNVISEIYKRTNLQRAIVLTAERAAIQLFSTEILTARNGLINDLLDISASQGDFGSTLSGRARRYSSPINAGLEDAAGLKNLVRETGDFAELASVLEQRILGGQVHVGEYGEVSYAPSGGQAALRIEMSASIIKSLASLVFYLRHQSRKGDVLIIDEPELNLHPENQRKLGRFLCELANAGLDIIISTHSDYIIREVNNLILLNKPSLAGVKVRNGYTDAELIAPEHVSVVVFNLEGMPEQLEVGPEGFAVASIDDEIARMNRIASEIMLESEE